MQYRQFITETGKTWGQRPESERAEFLARTVEPRGHERLLQKVSQKGPEISYLRELTDPFWYNRHNGPVYSIGGAFVNFLIRRYGGKRFIELYFASRPGTFAADLHTIYGADLEDLEKTFWADAEQLAGSQLSTKEPTSMEADLGKTAQEAEAGRATKQGADTPKSAKAGVALEFRLAEAEPAAHLIEATVVGTARKVYLHKAHGVTNNDIADARATLDQWMKPAVFIRLTEDGRKKMTELTDHKGKLLAILVDGKVISISTIWSKVSSSEAQFAVATKAEAERIAKSIGKK